MTREHAKALVMASGGRLTLYYGYSGRGVFGKRTDAVTGPEREIVRALRAVPDCPQPRFDSLGIYSIAY